MALAEVIGFETAAGVGVEAPADKCGDCLGTGAVLDDGSLTGIVGHPVVCVCTDPDPGACHVVAHPHGCTCSQVEAWRYRR